LHRTEIRLQLLIPVAKVARALNVACYFNPLKGICAQVEIQLYAYAVYKLCPLPFRYTITKVDIICPPPFKGLTLVPATLFYICMPATATAFKSYDARERLKISTCGKNCLV